jgi:RNA polymerase sigma factor (sigma-70 family)
LIERKSLDQREKPVWHGACCGKCRMSRSEYAEAFVAGYPATRRFLLSRGAGLEEAEEIAQAAWARGWEYRDQLRDPALVGFWVNSIARNLFRARFRAKPVLPIEGVDSPYTMNMEEIEVHLLLDRCPRRDRNLLERSLEGYSAEEIARSEGITSTGIRVRMLRIRQSLREQLSLAAV